MVSDLDKAIKGFFITEKDFEENLWNRIKYYHLLGFRVRKPATHRNDIIYPKGKHRKEEIDEEILKLCYLALHLNTNIPTNKNENNYLE